MSIHGESQFKIGCFYNCQLHTFNEKHPFDRTQLDQLQFTSPSTQEIEYLPEPAPLIEDDEFDDVSQDNAPEVSHTVTVASRVLNSNIPTFLLAHNSTRKFIESVVKNANSPIQSFFFTIIESVIKIFIKYKLFVYKDSDGEEAYIQYKAFYAQKKMVDITNREKLKHAVELSQEKPNWNDDHYDDAMNIIRTNSISNDAEKNIREYIERNKILKEILEEHQKIQKKVLTVGDWDPVAQTFSEIDGNDHHEISKLLYTHNIVPLIEVFEKYNKNDPGLAVQQVKAQFQLIMKKNHELQAEIRQEYIQTLKTNVLERIRKLKKPVMDFVQGNLNTIFAGTDTLLEELNELNTKKSNPQTFPDELVKTEKAIEAIREKFEKINKNLQKMMQVFPSELSLSEEVYEEKPGLEFALPENIFKKMIKKITDACSK